MPSVSVCIPTYNGAAYVEQAIRSVLDQSFTDFELWVVDDASTDDTANIVQSIHDPRLKLAQNPARLGLVGNWNRGLELARGEFVSLFHQDDVMRPGNLARKIAALQNSPTVGFAFSDVQRIDAGGAVLADHWFYPPPFAGTSTLTGADCLAALMGGDNFIACPSVVARRACFERMGSFNPHLPFTADLEMWLRFCLFYDVAYIETPLVQYRWHPGNETHRFSETEQWAQAYAARQSVFQQAAAHTWPDYPQTVRQTFQQDSFIRALSHIRHGRFAAGGWYFKFGAAVQPGLLSASQSLVQAVRMLFHKKE